jgi:dTDP-4-dehydrorhamnose 3,5-epimerase
MSEQRVFTPGKIEDVVVTPLRKFVDERGWLAELWRTDKVDEANRPVMTYISQTEPGVARGPHEHVAQTDNFAFIGPGNFRVYLWDNRPDSPTFDVFQTFVVGQDAPTSVIIPEGVVHAYRNVSHVPGVVINSPNALYRGENYAEEIDEIRHEDDPDSPFTLDIVGH